MIFTVFGASGFIGGQLVEHLRRQGHEVYEPSRSAEDCFDRQLGHVIYAIGLTGDFRTRPFDTVEAHVSLLAKLLQRCRYESWLYLSSTRVYGGLDSSQLASEDTPLQIKPSSDALYDLSKLLGEALCLSQPHPLVRAARLSNVYGPAQSANTFLGSIIAGIRSGEVIIREAPESSKDYISISDVLHMLEAISLRGVDRLYNVASGVKVTHGEVAAALHAITGSSIKFQDNSRARSFPVIDVSRITEQFSFHPLALLRELPQLLQTPIQLGGV